MSKRTKYLRTFSLAVIIGVLGTVATCCCGWKSLHRLNTELPWSYYPTKDPLVFWGVFLRRMSATAYFMDIQVNGIEVIDKMEVETWAIAPARRLSADAQYLYVVGYGWPARACYAGCALASGTLVSRLGDVVMEPSLGHRVKVRMPLDVYWPGFVLNVVVFGTCYLLLYVIWLFTRTCWWRRSGRCVECGYDLSGLCGNRCPECGRRASPKSTRQPRPLER